MTKSYDKEIEEVLGRQLKRRAYTYVSELWKKKQSDVMRFLLRVRCWEYRQLPAVVRVTHPTRPDKARRLGYKAKQENRETMQEQNKVKDEKVDRLEEQLQESRGILNTLLERFNSGV
ncbi:PREDICTED: 60S ribosomal protein L15-like [Erythranthe guttata]|uniref:60S ribosomal protein L15-like n=1 Tax=Erythranthe guttata TaxID=4155 RepID=UPI00064E0C03|nr:PREDICTED: 60S ribosomal protein L15-like [Erythranthe guttata]|eukprot:XP_012845692.1 PREDICTED: 60S ribosomal protein L15-like [Erythranthe guttata]